MARKKNKRRISIKKVTRLLVIVIFLMIILFNHRNIMVFFISKTTGYDFDTVQTFVESDIYDEIKDYEYSKTLASILDTEYYKDKYVKEYVNINYVDKDSFLENISLLLDKGYNSKDINNINNLLNECSIDILLNIDYFENISDFITLKYFHEDYLDRYIQYYNEEELDVETAITYVNIGLDNDYYTNVMDVINQDSVTVLVNKYNKLHSDFVPSDLQNVSYGSGKLVKEAATAFDLMCSKAKEDNIKIYGGSGYRSYSYQLNLYNRYVGLDGKSVADTYSARAGYSEHQTGLAMDILNGGWEYIDENDKEFTWLINNSYKYGFILRYLEGKEKITGYMYEPWHFRYIGVELATEITGLGITYDEYVAKNS